MLEFLWNLPIFLAHLGINMVFWGSMIALIVVIFKWGVEVYVDKFKKSREEDDHLQNPEDWGV